MLDALEWESNREEEEITSDLKPRTPDPCLELRFENVAVEFEEYPTGLSYASRLVVLIRDVKVLDHMESSTWRTFLTYSASETIPRESGSNMVHYEVLKVRPDPQNPAEESRMKIKLVRKMDFEIFCLRSLMSEPR